MKIEQSIIDEIRSRPRFKIYTTVSRTDYTEKLKELVNQTDEYNGNINSETALITVQTDHNHYWKPTLALRTELDEEKQKTVIRGVFGPSSAVWTFFMFLNFIFGILWMIGITLWYVERQIGSNDFGWALPFSFVMIACLLLTFITARLGRHKAKGEMQRLRNFAERSILHFEHHQMASEDSV